MWGPGLANLAEGALALGTSGRGTASSKDWKHGTVWPWVCGSRAVGTEGPRSWGGKLGLFALGEIRPREGFVQWHLRFKGISLCLSPIETGPADTP